MDDQKKVCFVSRSWLCHERSGVTHAVALHVNLLVQAGYSVSIIGSDPRVVHERLPAEKIFYVPAFGSGSLYSPARVDRLSLVAALKDSQADLVIVEGWQTALTTAAVREAYTLEIPVLMISHGSSVDFFDHRFLEHLRSSAWKIYKYFVLPKLIMKVAALTTLDLTAISARFFDRDLARRLGKPVLPLVNSPANYNSIFVPRECRKRQVLVIGYFSRIKNQLAAIDLASRISIELTFKFIGIKTGRYYKRCVQRADTLGIKERVVFLEDSECNLAEEISNSLLVLSNSITEVLPLALIEAMASGTPFIATPVGAVPSLQGGLVANEPNDMRANLLRLIEDDELWQRCSRLGRKHYGDHFNKVKVKDQLLTAVEFVVGKSTK